MNLTDFLITQDGIRDCEQVPNMVEFVRNGGVFDQESLGNCKRNKKIAFNQFEDNRFYLHDGHHRVAAIWISSCKYGTRDFLFPEEYMISNFTYARYRRCNFQNCWYTPFDPRTHVRLPNFFKFREQVRLLSDQDPNAAIKFVAENTEKYLVPRTKKHSHISGILPKSILNEYLLQAIL